MQVLINNAPLSWDGRRLITPESSTTGEMSGWLEEPAEDCWLNGGPELADGCWLKDGVEPVDGCWLKGGPELADDCWLPEPADDCWLEAGAEGPTALALALSSLL